MDFDKAHAKCFAALPKIAKGDVPPKFAKHAQAHLAECEVCRAELARLNAGGEPMPLATQPQATTLSELPTGSIPVSAGVPRPPIPLVTSVEPSAWQRWGPVLALVVVAQTAILGWVLFQSGRPLSVFIRCMAEGG